MKPTVLRELAICLFLVVANAGLVFGRGLVGTRGDLLQLGFELGEFLRHALEFLAEVLPASHLERNPANRQRGFDAGAGPVERITVHAGTLVQLSLLALYDRDARVTLAGGQSLLLKLAFEAGAGLLEPASIELSVDVSSERVTPVPQAAYALLRWQTVDGAPQVECVRFAWAPQASRIELVCPDDLRRQVVRRRAVFLWTDTARAGAATGYAVQKITRTGSTHLPDPTPIEVARAGKS